MDTSFLLLVQADKQALRDSLRSENKAVKLQMNWTSFSLRTQLSEPPLLLKPGLLGSLTGYLRCVTIHINPWWLSWLDRPIEIRPTCFSFLSF